MSESAPQKILLLRPDRAGDALKTLPPLRALLASGAVTQPVHLLLSDHNASLFAYEPDCTRHVLPALWQSRRPQEWLDTLRQRGMPFVFDKAICLLCDPTPEIEALLDAIPASEKYCLPRGGAPLPGTHALQLPNQTPAGRDESRNIALILEQVFQRELSLDSVSRPPNLSADDHREALEKMGEKTGPWLGFCPFAGLAHRTLPLRRWESFLPRVTRSRRFSRFFLFGTPQDRNHLEDLWALCRHRERIDICYPSSFRALGAYLQRLDGLVAVDSGPLHLAQALGLRSLGILSGGDVKRWFAQRAQGTHIVRRGLLDRYPSSWEMRWAFGRWSSSIDGPAALR